MMFWVEFEEACDVCGILRGGHHHSTGEPGCCFEGVHRPRHRVILPIAGDSFEEANANACIELERTSFQLMFGILNHILRLQ